MARLGKLTRQLESTVGRLLGTEDAGDSSEPLALVTGILRDVEQRIEPIGGGRRRFPYTHLGVIVLALRKEDQDRCAAALEDLDAKIRERFAELACEPPARLDVAVQFARKPRKHWTPDQRVELLFSRDTPASTSTSVNISAGASPRGNASPLATATASSSGGSGSSSGGRGTADSIKSTDSTASTASAGSQPRLTRASAAASPSPAPPVRIAILRGTGLKRTYALQQSTIRLGRGVEHAEASGRTRHNDIAFADDQDEVNRTVARAQAHLRFDASRGEFRLFDDGSSNGTRLVRDAEIITVTPHGPRGVRVITGDIIELGRARLRIDIDT